MSEEEEKPHEQESQEQSQQEQQGQSQSQERRRGSVQRPVESEEERLERLARQEEIDSRSVYVGNVDYQSTPDQVEKFLKVVGEVQRVTILFDKYTGLSKGYAYVEFVNLASVERAVNEIHGKEFRGREIRVTPKRTNLPGFRKRGGARGNGGFRGKSRGGGSGGFRRPRRGGGYGGDGGNGGNGGNGGRGSTKVVATAEAAGGENSKE
ncbi:uncharacterized protein LODBEIA_P36020 [Lodderomyces beijingensis]|uniref:RRM domain-containing protein n=1 Tax=Lodderomyces beijingensis TaxID=1775926 RepID=A0ABP0ZNW4_9ASCO